MRYLEYNNGTYWIFEEEFKRIADIELMILKRYSYVDRYLLDNFRLRFVFAISEIIKNEI